MNIGKSIKVACAIRGFTQLRLANEIGVSEQAVSGWVRHKTIPSLAAVERMAETLELSVSKFIHLGE